MSALQRTPPSDNAPSQVAWGLTILGTASVTNSTGNLGGYLEDNGVTTLPLPQMQAFQEPVPTLVSQ